uniref:Ig-like domain-containing protein n=1 Tax=Plectus sambesii TaxID=2011161 RepID=A0A914VMF1_9BILA
MWRTTKIVQLGPGEPFALQCGIVGEFHDLAWFKDGEELEESDSLTIVDFPRESGRHGKAIVFSGFDADDHAGAYECYVKRKDDSYQSRKLLLQEKLSNPQITKGFIACPKEKDELCLNYGICMMHKASGSVSCLYVHLSVSY